MNYIGNVIKQLRKEKELTRPQLVDEICSIKHLYLIEKGERTPSAEMTRHLGFKLGVDLFEYFEFLDCENPIGVHDTIKRFNIYHTIPDFSAVKKLSDNVRSWPDF